MPVEARAAAHVRERDRFRVHDARRLRVVIGARQEPAGRVVQLQRPGITAQRERTMRAPPGAPLAGVLVLPWRTRLALLEHRRVALLEPRARRDLNANRAWAREGHREREGLLVAVLLLGHVAPQLRVLELQRDLVIGHPLRERPPPPAQLPARRAWVELRHRVGHEEVVLLLGEFRRRVHRVVLERDLLVHRPGPTLLPSSGNDRLHRPSPRRLTLLPERANLPPPARRKAWLT
jgi:hypothetical protein